MNTGVRVQIDNNRINGRLEAFEGMLCSAVKQQVKKGSDDFTPYLGGDLMDSADPSAHDMTPYLVYDIVYGQNQFYANGGAPTKDFEHRSRGTHPNATMMWVDAYLSAGGNRDIQYLLDHPGDLIRF